MIHPSAVVDADVVVGRGTAVWHFCHLSKGAVIGEDCVLGQNVFVAPNVQIGNRVKIQNNVSIYEGVELDDDVFCGPSAVFTNIANPRSAVRRKGIWVPTRVGRGVTIGANATIVCGTTIGRHAFIGAGAVVTRQRVPDYALMLGVPARARGWASRHGIALPPPGPDGMMVCPESGWRYRLVGPDLVQCMDRGEDEPID